MKITIEAESLEELQKVMSGLYVLTEDMPETREDWERSRRRINIDHDRVRELLDQGESPDSIAEICGYRAQSVRNLVNSWRKEEEA